MLYCDIYRNGNLLEYFENLFCDVIVCFVVDVLFDFLLIYMYFIYIFFLFKNFERKIYVLNEFFK